MANQADAATETKTDRETSGEVYRRRYTRYSGAREGRRRSYMAIILHSVKRALGIRRKWTSKILPIILYSAAFIPVIGFISVPAIFGTDMLEFGSADLFSAISLILLVFAAAASPEMLCDDRRENVLPLYYSRGFSRWDYLAAKMLALGSLMLSVSLIPAMILFLGNTFLQDAPLSQLASDADEILRIIAASLLLSAFFAAIGLAISSMTERKGIASAIYIGFFMAGTAIANGLWEAIDQSWADVFAVASPLDLPDGILLLLFDHQAELTLPVRAGIEPLWYLVVVAGYLAVSAMLLYRRYLRED